MAVRIAVVRAVGTRDTSRVRVLRVVGTLSIGARSGTYPGMPASRTIHVRFVSGPSADAGNFDAPARHTIQYSGQAVEIRR